VVYLQVLDASSVVVPVLDRDLTVLIPVGGQALPPFELPAEFYSHTKKDLQTIVSQRQLEKEREGTLRTQAMREVSDLNAS
jgi:hypothetical protein